uniref:FABP domain-containing protein n=1 Tax=Parastrongyloides trichosuri TaxID=131310 RepID=A0A0N4Z5D1_PARTI
MVEQFSGTWVDPVTENMDEYLKEIGIGFVLRKLAKTIKDKAIITIEGNKFTLISESTFKNHTYVFTFDEKVLVNTIDGRQHYSILTYKDGEITEEQFPYKNDIKLSTIKRRIEGGKLVVTMECNGVQAKCVYTRSS